MEVPTFDSEIVSWLFSSKCNDMGTNFWISITINRGRGLPEITENTPWSEGQRIEKIDSVEISSVVGVA